MSVHLVRHCHKALDTGVDGKPNLTNHCIEKRSIDLQIEFQQTFELGASLVLL